MLDGIAGGTGHLEPFLAFFGGQMVSLSYKHWLLSAFRDCEKLWADEAYVCGTTALHTLVSDGRFASAKEGERNSQNALAMLTDVFPDLYRAFTMSYREVPTDAKDEEMLKNWSIKNFNPIVDSGELELAPVTVFAERNSSGKSSLLQSILMIAQTLGSRLLDRPLLPNECLVQLGTFEDILHENAVSRNIELSLILQP